LFYGSGISGIEKLDRYKTMIAIDCFLAQPWFLEWKKAGKRKEKYAVGTLPVH